MENDTTKQNSHLVIYLIWPVLAGLALAVVLAVSVGGIVAVLSRGDWRIAGTTAGMVFFTVLGLATLTIFWYAAHEFAGPRRAERIERTRQIVEYIEPAPLEPEVRFIPMRGRPPALNTPTPQLPSRSSGVRAAIGHLADRLTATATVHELATRTLEPDAPSWVREFYDTLIRVWPTQSLSRRTFESLWPGGKGKRLWRKYVNGTGSRQSQKGIWDTWGIVANTGKRGSWEWTQTLDVIFALDADLHAYATAKANMHSPTERAGATRRDTGAGQTGTNQSARPDVEA